MVALLDLKPRNLSVSRQFSWSHAITHPQNLILVVEALTLSFRAELWISEVPEAVLPSWAYVTSVDVHAKVR